MKIPGFTLDGKGVTATPKAVLAGVTLLKKLPDGQLITTVELCKRLGYTRATWTGEYSALPPIAPFKARIRFPSIQTVYGNRKTIAKLLKEKDLIA